MELNRDGGQALINFHFLWHSRYSLTMSGDRNWDLDLINVIIAHVSFFHVFQQRMPGL